MRNRRIVCAYEYSEGRRAWKLTGRGEGYVCVNVVVRRARVSMHPLVGLAHCCRGGGLLWRASHWVYSELRGGFFSTLLQYPRPHPLNQAHAPCGENNLGATVASARNCRDFHTAFFPAYMWASPCHRCLDGTSWFATYYYTPHGLDVMFCLHDHPNERRFSSRFFCTRLAQWH